MFRHIHKKNNQQGRGRDIAWIKGKDHNRKPANKESLTYQEYIFRTAFESALDGIAILDIEGNVVESNPAAREMFGYGNAAEEELHINIYDMMTEASREKMKGLKEAYSETPVIRNRVHEMKHRDGRIIFIEVSSTLVPDPDGNPVYVVATFRDITKNIEQETILKEALKKAEESDRLKTAFLTNMSHEIRTPMNAIVGFSDMLSNPDLSDDEKREFIKYIEQSSETLLHLINDILDISKIEAGQFVMYKEPFSLDEFMKDFCPFMEEIQQKYNKSHLDLRFHSPEQKGVMLNSDRQRIKQILTNLAGNALKFTDEGFVEIGCSVENDTAFFYVKDSGPGIPEDEQSTIFERFRQMNNSLTRKFGGAGLGLAISKNLVENLGGKISLNSIPGHGTTFYFTIPGIVDTMDKASPKKVPGLGNGYPDWHDKTVLIAEDEVSNYDFLVAILKNTGIHILHAKTGKEAVSLCANNRPDLLLMDIRMPEMDGFSSLREIREKIPGIPAIVQTAYAMADERQKCLHAGFNDYLAKPIKPKVLLEKVNEYLFHGKEQGKG